MSRIHDLTDILHPNRLLKGANFCEPAIIPVHPGVMCGMTHYIVNMRNGFDGHQQRWQRPDFVTQRDYSKGMTREAADLGRQL